MTVRQVRAQQTRDKIIAAAQKLISEKGFDAVQIEDITKEAGVAKGSFYTYFKHKEDVVDEIAYSRFDTIHARSARGGDVCDRITAFITGSMEYIKETGIRIAQQWVRSVVEPNDRGGVKKLIYDRRVIRELLKQAVDRGELSEETPIDTLVSDITVGYYGAVFCWAILDGEEDPVCAISDFCSTMMRDSIKHYMK